MSTNEQALALAAQPEFAQALAAAGGTQSVAQLAAAAQAENLKKATETVVTDASSILSAASSKLHDNMVAKAKLENEIKKLEDANAETKRAIDYFNATNNLFPLRKNVGLPTSKNILAAHPEIDTIPKDWSAPTAAAATAA